MINSKRISPSFTNSYSLTISPLLSILLLTTTFKIKYNYTGSIILFEYIIKVTRNGIDRVEGPSLNNSYSSYLRGEAFSGMLGFKHMAISNIYSGVQGSKAHTG